MTTPLFRREVSVSEFQRQHRHWGETIILQPVSTKFLSWFLCAAIAAIVTFLCLAPYARKQTVVGYLAPASGTAKVFASTKGVIQAVFVEQGQIVHKGQPLLRVDTAQLTAGGRNVQQETLDVLRSQRRLLTQQIAAEQGRERTERNRLATTLQGLLAEMDTLKAQQTNQRERIKLSETLVRSASILRKEGLISNISDTRRVADVIDQRQRLSALHYA